MYLAQQRRFTSKFHKINKQKHWMVCDKLSAKMSSYYMNTCTATFTTLIISDVQLVIESIIDDALLQAIQHIKHMTNQFFGVVSFFCYISHF